MKARIDDLRVYHLSLEHVAELFALLKTESFGTLLRELPKNNHKALSAKIIASRKSQSGYRYYGIFLAGKLIGINRLSIIKDLRRGRFRHKMTVLLVPEFRGKEYAKSVILTHTEFMRDVVNKPLITAEVPKNNQVVKHLFESCLYTPYEEHPDYYVYAVFPTDEWEAAVEEKYPKGDKEKKNA